MKIGICTHALRHSGGMERYAIDLVDGLAALDVRPTLFAKAFDHGLPELAAVDAVRVAVNWLPGKLRDHAFAWRLPALQRRARVDLLIACMRVRTAQIAVCGGTHLGFLRAVRKRRTLWDRWQIALERDYYSCARLIVAHSRLLADELQRFYAVPDLKIRVVYPPARPADFSPIDEQARRELRKALGFCDEQVVVAFPSSSHERKGFKLLSDFFARTKLPVLLAVAGRPVPAGLRSVRYLGYRRDIESIYRAADYTVLASHYEPFGLVGIESVLCGTPVLLARNIGCAEVISPAAKIEFDASDPASLERAMQLAVARTQQSSARLLDPPGALTYDTGTVAHVRALLAAWEEVCGMPVLSALR